MRIDIPAELRGGTSRMYDVFLEEGRKLGDTESYAVELLRLLPLPIKQASVWLDRLTNLWRYEFGDPFDQLPGDIIVTGTNVHPPVSELYVSMRIADKRLDRSQLLIFLRRLANPSRHRDVLFEMRPMRDLGLGCRVDYEVSGFGERDTTLDWRVKHPLFSLLLDVKNRSRSLVQHLSEWIPRIGTEEERRKAPAPDPANLFLKVEEKFKESSILRQMQGVWIQTGIKEDKLRLVDHFNSSVDRRKVHFAILSDWGTDTFILARNEPLRVLLKHLFNITESDRFVSQDY